MSLLKINLKQELENQFDEYNIDMRTHEQYRKDVADFVIMDGPGATLMNMAVVGILAETYILLMRRR